MLINRDEEAYSILLFINGMALICQPLKMSILISTPKNISYLSYVTSVLPEENRFFSLRLHFI